MYRYDSVAQHLHISKTFCNFVRFYKIMTFSIVIPIYNTALYLSKCLDSVLAQSNVGWEMICVNDGSTDDSLQLLQEYARKDNRIHVLTQPNQGLSAARNAGMAAAQGEWLLFLDSDDCLASPAALQILENNTLPDTDVLAFSSELWYPEEDDRYEANVLFNHSSPKRFSKGWDYMAAFVEERGWGHSAACFYLWKRALIEANDLLFPPGLLHEDEWFVPMLLSKAGGVQTMSEVLYSYRMRSGSIAHGGRNIRHATDKLHIAQRLQRELAAPADKRRTKKRLLYNLARNAAHNLPLLSQDWWQAKLLMLKNAVRTKEYIRVITG